MTRQAHGYGLATIAADGTVLDTWFPAPALGEHTEALLRELGYDAARIECLRGAGIV